MLKLLRPANHPLVATYLTTLGLLISSPVLTAKAASQELHDSIGVGFYSELGFEHSDNIFHLTSSQQSTMEANDAEDSNSGRFEGMESNSDTILSPAIGIKYDIKWLGDKDLSFSTRVRYNYYLENQEKSYPAARIRLEHDIGKKSALLLEGNFSLDFFKQNYLTGYNDENENGNISRDERTYSPAVYDEYEGVLAYTYKPYKNKGKPLSQVDLRPFFGYSTRVYSSSFGNRSRDVAFGGLELAFEFFSRIDLELIYQYENTHYPGNDELVLFDETRVGSDINADGEIEANAPLVTPIDRSANRHTLEINPSLKITKEILFYLGYERRISDFTSDNPLDIDHYGNTAYRQIIKAGFQYDFSKSWSTDIEYCQTDTDNQGSGDYLENSVVLSIRYDLL